MSTSNNCPPSRFPESDDELDFEDLDGYKRSTPDADHYVVKRESFRQVFTSTEQEILVTRWLAKRSGSR